MNLIDVWDSFKAAKTALGNSLEPENVHSLVETHMLKLKVRISFSLFSDTVQNVNKKFLFFFFILEGN